MERLQEHEASMSKVAMNCVATTNVSCDTADGMKNFVAKRSNCQRLEPAYLSDDVLCSEKASSLPIRKRR